MKKILFLAFTTLLSLNLLNAQPTDSAADQKWLAAVEKMVVKGKHQISTPVETRVQLLKDWAKKNGYAVQIVKVESTFRLELSKDLAKS